MCCAVFRVFGPQLAELPLVATRLGARRCGHARVLMAALERLCTELGVASLALPAAASTVDTWVGGFGFRPMTEEEAAITRSELRMLIFPGARCAMHWAIGSCLLMQWQSLEWHALSDAEELYI